MTDKIKYSGLVGAAQVTIDQAKARNTEEHVTLPIAWAVALNAYATALRKQQERDAASAQAPQAEAKVKAFAVKQDSDAVIAALTTMTINATRRSVQLTRWLEKAQAEELRLRQALYAEQQWAEALATQVKTLQADNDRLQDEAQRWEAAYQERGELIKSQGADIIYWINQAITLRKQTETNEKPCVWRHDPGGMWLTDCGSVTVTPHYAPFCPYCGHETEKL